jgi:hypothetical protein
MKKQPINEQFRRMQKLAGLITENFNAIDPKAPDWKDYEGYELVLEDYFQVYKLENSEDFRTEYDNGDAQNNLAFDIAERAGFKGGYEDLLSSENSQFNLYCNYLAKLFLLEYGMDMGVIDRNDPEWKKELSEINSWLDSHENYAMFNK